MLTSFRLIKKIGKFLDVTTGRALPLDRLTLIYADNGRGKTTLSAILRSLGSGDPAPIIERRRLGENGHPEVVLDTSSGAVIFRDGRWSAAGPKVAIFDDAFVAQNIHAGMSVDANHRQNLHDLIIGAQGVTLNRTLQQEIERNEQHNRALAKGGDLIPRRLRGDLSPDKFYDIQNVGDLPAELARVERALAAARDSDAVQRHPPIPVVRVPRIDVDGISAVLSQTLEDIQQSSLAEVQRHIRSLGKGGEAWVADGQARAVHMRRDQHAELCPYCAQPLSASHVAEHYNDYFSEGYRQLRHTIERAGKDVAAQHTGNAVAEFQRQVRVIGEEIIYWGRFIQTRPVAIQADDLVRHWNAASAPVLDVLRQKFAAPLDALTLDPTTLAAIAAYQRAADALDETMVAVERMNADIAVIKEGAGAGSPAVLERDMARLRQVEARYSPEGVEAAARYNAEREAKVQTEQRRDAARRALDAYRRDIFPRYEARINHYLGMLHTGFRLGSVSPVNTRQGSSATYHVLLDEIDVPVALTVTPNEPSVKTTLSSGDRNALALAFFLTSLELDPDPTRLVLLDDPMTSLDEHRTLATVREILELRHTAGQVIVLSHSKSFLSDIWKETSSNDPRRALRIMRHTRDTSTFTEWDVSQETISEHDRRSDLLHRYLNSPVGINERHVAEALRPMLETFLRVASPRSYPPEALIGGFLRKVNEALGSADEILNARDATELDRLTAYANRYHHSNAGYRTEVIRDDELRDNVRRVLAFTRRN